MAGLRTASSLEGVPGKAENYLPLFPVCPLIPEDLSPILMQFPYLILTKWLPAGALAEFLGLISISVAGAIHMKGLRGSQHLTVLQGSAAWNLIISPGVCPLRFPKPSLCTARASSPAVPPPSSVLHQYWGSVTRSFPESASLVFHPQPPQPLSFGGT